MTNPKAALIIGAGHGIGFGFVEKLLEDETITDVYATHRISEKSKLLDLKSRNKDKRLKVIQFDPNDEDNYQELIDSIEHNLYLCINCIGTLHHEGLKPEKSLRDISFKALDEYFKVNSSITPMLAKYLKNKLRHKDLSIFATVSAKVGSISDNKLGGWYGYRASKAALNMFLTTIDIEFKRNKFNCIVRSLHPGTTITELSKPFTNNTKYKLHTPYECASNLLLVLASTQEQDHLFYSWDGQKIDW